MAGGVSKGTSGGQIMSSLLGYDEELEFHSKCCVKLL